MFTRHFAIILIWACVLDSGLLFASSKMEFLRTQDYQPFYRDVVEYSGGQTIDLGGKWYFRQKGEDSWRIVELPASWDNFNGTVHFRRSFTLPPKFAEYPVRLMMLGVFHHCRIRLNGDLLGSQEGGIVDVELPPRLLRFERANELEIEVGNVLSPLNTIPLGSGLIRPADYGGITRDIFLLAGEHTAVEGLVATTTLSPDLSTGTVEVRIGRIRKDFWEGAVGISYRLSLLNGKTAASGIINLEEHDAAFFKIDVRSPLLWSPEEPNLYRLEVFPNIHYNSPGITREIGFRRIDFDDKNVLLNSKPVKIKGLRYVEQSPDGITMTGSAYRNDVDLIIASGANSLLVNSTPHPYLLQLCDRRGIMVFLSSSLTGVPTVIVKREKYLESARQHLKNLPILYGAHASVVAWGIGMELESYFPWRELALAFPQDESVIFFMGIAGDPGKLKLFSPDFTREGAGPDLPCDVGMYLPDSSEWAQEIQLASIDRALAEWKDSGGIFLKSFSDWRANRAVLFHHPYADQDVLLCGLLDRYRQPRLAFHQLEKSWQSKRVSAPIAIVSNEPLTYPVLGFILLVLFLLGLRKNKVFRNNLSRTFTHSHGFFSDIQNHRFIQKAHTMAVGAGSALAAAFIFSAIIHQLRSSESFDYLLAHLCHLEKLHGGIIKIIWSPLNSILYIFLFLFLFYILNSLFFILAARILRYRVRVLQAFFFIIWASACLLWLIPLTMFFYKGLSLYYIRIIELGLVGICLLWWCARILNALRTVCRTRYVNVFPIFAGFHILVIGAFVAYLQITGAVFHYWDYFFAAVLK